MSEHANKLKSDVLLRYSDKIAAINHFDPYTIPKEVFSTDLSVLPNVTVVDIIYYFILTRSFYTGQQMKAYKSLEAYQFVTAGFVTFVKQVKLLQIFLSFLK